jgi:hypothetical protein
VDNDYYRGIIWELWRGDYSLYSARMMVRSKSYNDRFASAKMVPDSAVFPDP